MALRIRARKSATGSVRLIAYSSFKLPVPQFGTDVYHEDFETPGSSPLSASPRKHKRQMPNLRRYPRGRPQILQRLCRRVENFGFLASFTLFAVVAILSLSVIQFPYGRNGIPMCRSSA